MYRGGKGRKLEDDGQMEDERETKRAKEAADAWDAAFNKRMKEQSRADKEWLKRSLERDDMKADECDYEFTEVIPSGSRPRLWHEPPQFDYSDYEAYEEVQKMFKNHDPTADHGESNSGTELVAWTINHGLDLVCPGGIAEGISLILDWRMERELLIDYRTWSNQLSLQDDVAEADQVFYAALRDEIDLDRRELRAEKMTVGQTGHRYQQRVAEAHDLHWLGYVVNQMKTQKATAPK